MSVFKKSALLVGLMLGLLWANTNVALCQVTGTNSYEVEMVYVPGGTFNMGCTFEQTSDCGYDEKPAHSVTLRGFTIAKYEVTQKLWREVMGSNPSRHVGDNLPVQNVSWDDIQLFIERLNQKTGMHYRLPTEAEWEYAARGGAGQDMPYQFSGGSDLDLVGWYSGNSGETPHEVGTKQPNALGLYDMSGNVWEWCNDLYDMYSDKAQENPTGGTKGLSRVIRGGCYIGIAKQCRVAARKNLYQGGKDAATGFRLAMNDDREAQAAAKAEQERLQAEENARQAEQQRIEEENKRIAAAKQARLDSIAAVKAAADSAKKAERERIAAEKAAEQERIAAEEAAAAAAQKAEQERIAAEWAAEQAAKKAKRDSIARAKTALKMEQQQIEQHRRDSIRTLPFNTFFTLNAACSPIPQWSYGFKIGQVRRAGWYLNVMTNFNFKGAFSNFTNNHDYLLTGRQKTTRLSANVGLVVRPCNPMSILIGAGFGYRSMNIETTGGWFNYSQRTFYGPEVAFGLMFHAKWFVISAEAVSIPYDFNKSDVKWNNRIEGRLGIGFMLPNKRK